MKRFIKILGITSAMNAEGRSDIIPPSIYTNSPIRKLRIRNSSVMNLHVISHSSPVTISGDIRKFTQVCSINLHKNFKAHFKVIPMNSLGSKPFTCPVCEKAFSEKYNLESHLKTHPLTDLSVPKAQE